MINSALWYHKKGYAIIPIREKDYQDKKVKSPYIKWDEFKTGNKPTEAQIREWWRRWPNAMIGLITGITNKVSVIDFDIYKLNDLQAEDLIKQFPGFKDIKTPVATTPKNGYHFYFKYHAEIPQGQDIYPNVDGRNNGGYIILPPSAIDGNGSRYSWLDNKSIGKCPLCPIPEQWLGNIKQHCKDLYIPLTTPKYTTTPTIYNNSIYSINRGGAPAQRRYFKEGRRDDDLFHAGYCLVKGGADPEFTMQTLELVANNLGNEFGPDVVRQKIKSILQRSNKAEANISEEVRDWVETTSGYFLTTECHKELELTTKTTRKAAVMALLRLCEKGVIEKHGNKRGCYRRVEKKPDIQNWWDDEGAPLNLRWPLGIETYVNIYPGNIILLEGAKSQGKSTFAIEFCRMNYKRFRGPSLYQNIEMAKSELKQRFNSYGDLFPYNEAKRAIDFIRVNDSWWDYINPNGLNIIDYMVEYEKAYILPQYIKQIHEKLNDGIVLILVQRDAFKPYGTGGRGIRDLPRLVISLIGHTLKLEDVKSFKMTGAGNPTGLAIDYKHVNYCELHAVSEWYVATEEKYKNFI